MGEEGDSPAENENICPSCGVSVPPSAPGGLCPKCLLDPAHLPTVAGESLSVSNEFPVTEPCSIGPYRILYRLGEGGMGQVYAAEQKQPIRRRVALKVIKPGMDSREILARFEAERQAVAMMDHANIARVYEAGSTEDGRPYFAMELVEGLPLTNFCDEKKLSLRERLILFQKVCHAVQHAHQKGIIHRDLKPSNILVVPDPEDGDTPIPKIIDFGIAKAVGPALTENTLYTLAGQVLGTLQYMSPEQASFDAGDVDTRADIFALGVILYELLTGGTPLEISKLRKVGIEAALRAVTECEFSKPSTKLSTIEDSSRTTIAEVRGMPSSKLAQSLRGDLDWIVMKALEKDRSRRYETANALARDIQNYLSDEPVSASPPSFSYQLGKLARRHRVLFSAAGSILAIILVALVLVLREAERARQAERAETREREKAELEAKRSREILSLSDFHRASELLETGAWNEGLAYLARSLEIFPANERSIQRSLHLLMERNWSVAGHMEILNRKELLEILAEESPKNSLEVSLRDLSGREFSVTFQVQSDTKTQYHGWTRYDRSGINGDHFMLRKALPSLRKEKTPIKGVFSDPVPVAYSSDGNWLAAPGGEELLLFNRDSGKEKTGFFHSERIHSVAFHPDSKWVATGGHDKQLKIWDIEEESLFSSPISREGVVTEIAFSEDGEFLLTFSASDAACWRIQDRRRSSPENQHSVSAWNFSRKEALSYSGLGTRRVNCYSLASSQEIGEVLVEGEVLALRFLPDLEKLVIIHSAGAESWDAKLQQQLDSVRWESGPFSMHWLRDDSDCFVLEGEKETEKILVFDASEFRVLLEESADEPWKSARVVNTGANLLIESEAGLITKRQLLEDEVGPSGFSLGEGKSLYGNVWSDQESILAFVRGNPHEKWNMVSSFEIWDLLSGKPLSRPFYHSRRGMEALSGVAKAICVQDLEGSGGVGIYNLDGTLRFSVPIFPLADCKFSDDGTKILVRPEFPGPSQIFDTESGRRFPLRLEWMNAAMDPSGRFAMSRNSLWDIATGRRLSDPLVYGKGYPEYSDGNEYWASMELLPSEKPVRWVRLDNRYYIPFIDPQRLEAPAWYPKLLRAIAGMQIDEEGSLQAVQESHEILHSLKEQLAAFSDETVFSRISNWWFLPPEQREEDPLAIFPERSRK